ncbi:MAG: MarR family transcriptional regulator [Peptococcaceae bacterium]|nr:MarR family transcriptional regulator [Peptococcaceae bacterium]
MDNLSREVINSFISLTEKIANSKTNVLNFEGEDMTFYRGEIHMIKMIGDYPGIFSSEIARRFGITRAVVHKTLIKLEERRLVTRAQDEKDRKRFQLYLTPKGKQAYRFHEEYHNRYDRELFDYIRGLPGPQLEAIKGFMEHANNLIQNHA